MVRKSTIHSVSGEDGRRNIDAGGAHIARDQQLVQTLCHRSTTLLNIYGFPFREALRRDPEETEPGKALVRRRRVYEQIYTYARVRERMHGEKMSRTSVLGYALEAWGRSIVVPRDHRSRHCRSSPVRRRRVGWDAHAQARDLSIALSNRNRKSPRRRSKLLAYNGGNVKTC
jgi:hypothetical protein